MNINKKNVKQIVILGSVIAVVIVGVILLIILGNQKPERPSGGTETENISTEEISSEDIATDEDTEVVESESSETETPLSSEMETEEQQEDTSGNNTTGNTGNTNSGTGNNTNNGGNTGNNSGSGNAGNNTGNSGGNQGNTGNSGGGNISEIAPNIPQYDPMDANKDGSVSAEEEMMYITPAKQKCIDAGYGVVVEQDGGEWYAVLMESNKHTIDGKRGGDILDEYLKERGLHADRIGGCWINPDNGWYWYTAEQIEEIPEDPMGDDFNWEDGEIEWH